MCVLSALYVDTFEPDSVAVGLNVCGAGSTTCRCTKPESGATRFV